MWVARRLEAGPVSGEGAGKVFMKSQYFSFFRNGTIQLLKALTCCTHLLKALIVAQISRLTWRPGDSSGERGRCCPEAQPTHANLGVLV